MKKVANKQNLNKSTMQEWNLNSKYLNEMLPEIKMRTLWKAWIQDNEEANCFDHIRFYSFLLNLNNVCGGVEGSLAELGVYRGNSAAIIKYYADKYDRKLYLYDTFEGFDERDLKNVDKDKSLDGFSDTALDYVKRKLGETVVYRKGFFPESINEEDFNERFAFVSLDCDLYAPTLAGLKFFYPRLNPGGMIFCHDYSSSYFRGCTKAVDEFANDNKVNLVLLPDIGGTAIISK